MRTGFLYLRGLLQSLSNANSAVRRPTLAFLLLVAAAWPLLGEGAPPRDLAVAQTTDVDVAVVRITAPIDGAALGDGNLVLVEVEATGGTPDRVELAFGVDETWVAAQRDPTGRWSYVWADPPTGAQRIRARAITAEGRIIGAHNVLVGIDAAATAAFLIDNPYAGPGAYYRGQLHIHSTNSFDGWRSLPPAELAQEYRRRGYRFVVISDHDVVTYPREVEDAGFVVIPGYESTSDSGHITGAFVEQVVAASLPAQQRIDSIRAAGGIAILNHPGWLVGWSLTDVTTLRRYQAIEIFNGMTADTPPRVERNLQLWHQALNTRGWPDRPWAVAVDDSHATSDIDKAWIAVKAPRLTKEAVRRGIESGALYASNGPTFSALGVLGGALFAASPEARTIRFIDQDFRVVGEGPAAGARYQPKGTERWIRIEAIAADGQTAWSQPFWLLPNSPRVELVTQRDARALSGTALPGARVHVSDNRQYLGSVTAGSDGVYSFRLLDMVDGRHDFWVLAVAPWPDQIQSLPTITSYTVTGADVRASAPGS